MRVLITEDDPIGRKVLELFLLPYGDIDGAGSGEDALKRIEDAWAANNPINLLFLDIGLPGKSGIETLAVLRDLEKTRTFKPISVVLLTGSAETEKIDEARRLGIIDYLMKPVEESKLLDALKRHGLIGTLDGSL